MKLRITFAAVAALALVVVAAAFAGSDGKAAKAARGSAAIACGTTRNDRSGRTDHRSGFVDRLAAAALGAVLRQALERGEGEREAEDRDRPG